MPQAGAWPAGLKSLGAANEQLDPEMFQVLKSFVEDEVHPPP